MGLILLEALGALAVLVLIVWWTMFSGRKRGEIDESHPSDDPDNGGPRG
jgi:cbb3-type cytochrome oxidase subunit 3